MTGLSPLTLTHLEKKKGREIKKKKKKKKRLKGVSQLH